MPPLKNLAQIFGDLVVFVIQNLQLPQNISSRTSLVLLRLRGKVLVEGELQGGLCEKSLGAAPMLDRGKMDLPLLVMSL